MLFCRAESHPVRLGSQGGLGRVTGIFTAASSFFGLNRGSAIEPCSELWFRSIEKHVTGVRGGNVITGDNSLYGRIVRDIFIEMVSLFDG